ncbi:MAG: hypothetical protein D6776_00730 [Planctomycetota bacterium]|nr:MAG: hypothetical protein D6776_00730 [Planctomycetota bacterium]
MQGRRMKSVLGRFARYGPALILGIGMIVVGVFVIKEKNWARIVSFALFGAAAMIVVSLMAVRMGSGGGVALPLTAIVLVTFGAAKLEWDLMVENFEPAAA